MSQLKTISSYVVGFILSLLLTIAAYLFVFEHLLAGAILIAVILGLAVIQLYVQLIFFLHLGREQTPRNRLIAFVFTAVIVGILVGGTLWIMNNLNYNMTPQQINTYLNDQSGF